METMDYRIDINVKLDWLNPPESKSEQLRRENAQANSLLQAGKPLNGEKNGSK